MRFFANNADYNAAISRGETASRIPSATMTEPETGQRIEWPDPTPEMLETPEFEAVWQCIKRWDVNVPEAYAGYSEATGNHVRAILDALAKLK